MSRSQQTLQHAEQWPFDASDIWWHDGAPPPPATDWAHAAARGIVAELQTRPTVKRSFNPRAVREADRVSLVAAFAAVIRTAAEALTPAIPADKILVDRNHAHKAVEALNHYRQFINIKQDDPYVRAQNAIAGSLKVTP